MIQSKDRFLEYAEKLLEPVVLVDTRLGSRNMRFWLMDAKVPISCIEEGIELPLALFRGLREKGILYEKAPGQLKVEKFRALLVNLKGPDDGGKEAAV